MLEKMIVTLIILAGIYGAVLCLIFADLWSGIRKAKERGEYISSQGFKRTVDKIARYYNALFALTILDGMQISAVWYFDRYWGFSIPIFPVVTLVGAIGVALIEIKSIYEKADVKERKQYNEVVELVMQCSKNHNIDDIAKALQVYFESKNN